MAEAITTSNEGVAGERARELYRTGYHCAEAVLVAVLEAMNSPVHPPIPRIATCFGGGVGRTHEETCGALVGGLMAVGCLLGRDQQGKSWDFAAQSAAEVRAQFQKQHGCTRCSDLLAAMGPQQGSHLCHALAAATAELTCKVLKA